MAARKAKKKKDLSSIEKELTALERRMMEALQEKIDGLQNTSAHSPNEFEDMAADGELDYMAAVSVEADSATIDQIDKALRSIREGTYGTCEMCGKRIPARRLKARPFATMCVHCKEKEEQLGTGRPAQAVPAGQAGISARPIDNEGGAAENSYDQVFHQIEDMGIVEMF